MATPGDSCLVAAPSTSTSSVQPTLTSSDSGYDSATKAETSKDPLALHRPYVLPAHDPTLLNHPSLLANLRAAEAFPERQIQDYWPLQKELRPSMRAVVVAWVRDVCNEECLEAEVFPLAIGLFDRFLGKQPIFAKNLQGLAAACIFLASKVKQTIPIGASRLVELTEDSVALNELMSWELLVLSRLDWDLAQATAIDFLQLILPKLNLPPNLAQRIRAVAVHLLSTLLMSKLPH